MSWKIPPRFAAIILVLGFAVPGVIMLWLGLTTSNDDKVVILSIAALFLALAVAMLILTPKLFKEHKVVSDERFVPLDHDGNAFHGTPAVRALAHRLHERVGGTPYHVLTSPNAVRVEWNTGPVEYRGFLSSHQMQRVFRSTLLDDGKGRFIRNDEEQRWDASAGLLRVVGGGSSSGGRLMRVERQVVVTPTANGLERPVDHHFDSRIIDRAITEALGSTGQKQRMSANTIGGIVGLLAGASAIVMTIILTVTQ